MFVTNLNFPAYVYLKSEIEIPEQCVKKSTQC